MTRVKGLTILGVAFVVGGAFCALIIGLLMDAQQPQPAEGTKEPVQTVEPETLKIADKQRTLRFPFEEERKDIPA